MASFMYLLSEVCFWLICFLLFPFAYLLSLENCYFSAKIGSPSSPPEPQTGLQNALELLLLLEFIVL